MTEQTGQGGYAVPAALEDALLRSIHAESAFARLPRPEPRPLTRRERLRARQWRVRHWLGDRLMDAAVRLTGYDPREDFR